MSGSLERQARSRFPTISEEIQKVIMLPKEIMILTSEDSFRCRSPQAKIDVISDGYTYSMEACHRKL